MQHLPKNRKYLLLVGHVKRIPNMDQLFCGDVKNTIIGTIKLKFSWKWTLWLTTEVSTATKGMPFMKSICE